MTNDPYRTPEEHPLTAAVTAVQIDPENPVRLRECLTALSEHLDTHVLRFEVGIGASTRMDGEPAFSMTLTHSLGPEHELRIVPEIAKLFAAAMAGFARKAAAQSEGKADG